MTIQDYAGALKISATDGCQIVKYHGIGKFLRLPSARTYAVGFDPATKKTGVYIRSLDDQRNRLLPKIRILIDISHSGALSKEIYFKLMADLFTAIFEGLKISLVIFEEPYTDRKSAFSQRQQKLQEFKGMFELLSVSIPAFSAAQFCSIPPGIWRKNFLRDKRHDGMRKERELLKLAAMEETICRYPKFEEYGRMFRSPADSFDAVGVLEGGMEELFYNSNICVRRFHSNMKAKVSYFQAYYDKISVAEPELQSFVTNYLDGYIASGADALIQVRGLAVYIVDCTYGFGMDEIASCIVSETHKVCMIIFKLEDRATEKILAYAKGVLLAEDSALFCLAWRERESSKILEMDSHDSYIELPDLFGIRDGKNDL